MESNQKDLVIEIKPGDKFLYESKYGGKIIDTISEISKSYIVNMEAKAYTINYRVRSSKGVWYELQEVQLVDDVMTDEDIDFLKGLAKYAREKKQKYQDRINSRKKNKKE